MATIPNLRIYQGTKQYDIFVESGSEIKLIHVLKHYTQLDHVKFIHCHHKSIQGRHINYITYTIDDIKSKPSELVISENTFWTVVISNPETETKCAVVSYKLEFSY